MGLTPRLGSVVTRKTVLGEKRFILTSVMESELLVWTPIPEGMDAQDLGRQFVAARVEWTSTQGWNDVEALKRKGGVIAEFPSGLIVVAE